MEKKSKMKGKHKQKGGKFYVEREKQRENEGEM